MDFKLIDNELPNDLNIEELQKALPASTFISSQKDEDGKLISITIHAEDNTNLDAIKTIIKNHVPTQTEEEAIETKLTEDFETKLSVSATVQGILSRITKLEGK